MKHLTSNCEITLEDIKNTVHTIDLINRPIIVICNPSQEGLLKQILSEDKYFFSVNPVVPEGMFFAADRKDFEKVDATIVGFKFNADEIMADARTIEYQTIKESKEDK